MVSEIIEGFSTIQKRNSSFLNGIDMSDTDQIKNTLFPNTLEIAAFFKEKEALITGLLSENSGIQFMDILYDQYYQHFLTALPQVFFIKFAPDIIEFYATYMTKGVAALVETWFQSGFKSSTEMISHAILNMLAPALSDLYSEKRSLYRCS
uniref:Transcriptional regulator TetR C-terminal Firmicutes type domain-containing protein n=1 Tax=Candidatus Enterococcus clewellii TaxID=1834193 RepID=A0A242K7P1_9ENTE|nr:hypothetical protein A5888_002159 [Enterococcus sp. 9E7_DIV0242]